MIEISKINIGGVDYAIRDKVLEQKLGDVNAKPMISVTYTELVTLRDKGELIAGMQYRITDYVTTTAQENTQSAGHQFDVIVTADNATTLNEVARACLHEGDTYFSSAGAKLEAWQLWYSLDNNAERFAWADAENGKGVIYRLIDEWNNDCPYDFKNIRFIVPSTFECSQYGVTHTYTANGFVIELLGVNYYGYTRTRTSSGPPAPPEQLFVNTETLTPGITLFTIADNTASVYANASAVAVHNGLASYTFQSGTSKIEASTNTNNYQCFDNTIRAYRVSGRQRLNFITFNTVSETLTAYSNSFGTDCHSNSFGTDCYKNSFGNDCHSNSFGHNCYKNSFGNLCSFNSFGNNCNANSFGDVCDANSFGADCYSNSFGADCYSNSFGADCRSNSFGDNCYSNSFGDNCYSNSFGNNCNTNSFGTDCYKNSFGDNCYKNSFEYFCSSNSFGNGSEENKLKAFYRNITLGEGVQYVTLQNDAAGDNNDNQVQNYRVATGTRGKYNAPLVIDVQRGLDYETTIAQNSAGEVKAFNLADLVE